jgi:lipopolysaccharide/colanic/teichoic acid biosynthesis glycosyltransferase
MLKRLCDILLASLLLLPLIPLFILLGLTIRLSSPGPIFYRGLRVGRNGTRFRIFKFRTMVMNADKIGVSSTADDDPRITRPGRLLRKYKLDELPQILNVIRGEMSFVGPRPEVPFYVNLFTEEEKIILNVLPGITDWASLWNSDEGALLAGAKDPERVYLEQIRPEKLRLQLKYVRDHSLLIDFRILIDTARTVLGRALKRRPLTQTNQVVHG